MRRLIIILASFSLWLMLSWSLNWENCLIGGIISIMSGFIFGQMLEGTNFKFLHPIRLFWFLIYIPVFTWEMTKANFDVAYRVLHPKMPIDPGIVKVKTELKSNMGKTFLANSITLTPGTLTVDIDGNILFIHCINVPAETIEEATKIIVNRFEPLLKRIFD